MKPQTMSVVKDSLLLGVSFWGIHVFVCRGVDGPLASEH